MRIRHRLALFWVLLAGIFALGALPGFSIRLDGGILFQWHDRFYLKFSPGFYDAILTVILLAATVAAWSPRRGRALPARCVRVLPWSGPWIFAALAWKSLWPFLPPLSLAFLMTVVCLAGAAAAVAWLLFRDWTIERAFLTLVGMARWIARREPWHWAIPAFALLLLIHAYVYRNIPDFGDSMSQLFQGLILASGHFKWPEWEYPLFFAGPGIIVDGGWYSHFPPGHCLLLAIGWLLHAPWAVNPALAAISMVLVWDSARRLYGPAAGPISAAIFVLNPWWPLMSAGFMNHVSTLFLFAASFNAALRASDSGRPMPSVAAGFFLGWAAATRPLTALAYGTPLIGAGLWGAVRGRRPGWAGFLAGASGFAIWIAFFLFYNGQTTGDPLVTGYAKLNGPAVTPGFHGGNRHTLLVGVEDVLVNLGHFRNWAPGAGLGAYLPLLWVLLFAPVGRREALLLLQWGLMGVIYVVHYWQDLGLGPRYLYESILPYTLLAAGGILSVVARMERWLARASGQLVPLRRALLWFVAGLCLVSAGLAIPQIERFRSRDDASIRFRRMVREKFPDPRMVVFINSAQLGTVFLETARHTEGPLFLDFVGEEWNRRFMDAHPDRDYWYISDSGAWPYEEAAESLHIGMKFIHYVPGIRAREEIAAAFHRPGGRKLPPAGSGR